VSDERIAGRHGFGNIPRGPEPGRETFSVGVFEWLPTVDGKSVKRGKIKVRVIGRRDTKTGTVAFACDEVARKLDAGTYAGPKLVFA
jgi:hypothetical protein